VPDGALDGYETAAQAAERLGIDTSQVRRYCEAGGWEGTFKAHPSLWLVPKGTTPERKSSGRLPGWAKQAEETRSRGA
jgi:hypothetical protein